jgi:2'-5' RNA ligase
MPYSSTRLFIAIRFSDAVAEELEALEDGFGIPRAAWTPSEQFHLTLRFLGDPFPATLLEIDRALREVRADSFTLDLKGIGHFPLRGDPETLWTGAVPCEPLLRLRHRVESALARAGIAPEGRKFHPHVSLARVKHAAPEHVAAFEIRQGLFSRGDIPVQAFHLFSSELKPGGAVHTLEATYPLEGMLEGSSEDEEED